MTDINQRLNSVIGSTESQISRDIEKSASRMDNLINNREHALQHSDQKQFRAIEEKMAVEQQTLDALLTIPVPTQKRTTPVQSERYIHSRWAKASQATIDERKSKLS